MKTEPAPEDLRSRTPHDPAEAPKGYRAKLSSEVMNCEGCAAHRNENLCDKLSDETSCLRISRTDQQDVVFVKAPERPSPRATFARWWKRHMNIHGLRNSNYNEDLARRAFNAGRRAAQKKGT